MLSCTLHGGNLQTIWKLVSKNISVQVLNGTPQWALLSSSMWPTHIACLFPIRFRKDDFNLCNFCSLRHWKNLSWGTTAVLGWFWNSLFEAICIQRQKVPFNPWLTVFSTYKIFWEADETFAIQVSVRYFWRKNWF